MSIKNLSRDFAFYGLLDLLQRSLGIIMIPIYTRVLSQNNYGNLDLIFTVCSALLVLVDLQFVPGFSRFYLEHQRTGKGPQFVGTVIITRVVFGAGIALIFLSLGFSGILEVKFIPSFLSNKATWLLLVLGIPLTFIYDILLLQTQMLRSKKWFFIGAVGNTLFSALLCVVFTVFFPLGIVGIALGQFIGKLVSTSLLSIGLRKDISFCYNNRLFKELIQYTMPLIPGWWICFSSAYIGRFFVYGGQGADQNAILAITTKLASILGLFSIAFRTAWLPMAMSYIGKEEGEKFYIRSLRLFMVGGVFSIFCLTVLSKPILAILAPVTYGSAEYYVPFFLIGSIIGELDINIQLGNQISKKTYWMSIGSAVAFIINLLILITFTARMGIYAVGLGLLISFIAKVLITYFSAQKNYKIQYDKKALFIFCFSCIVLLMLSIGRSIHVINNAVFFSSVIILGILFPYLMIADSEKQMIKNWFYS